MPKPTGAGKLYTGIAIPVSAWLGQQAQVNYILVVNVARPTGAGKLYTGIEYVHTSSKRMTRPTSAGKCMPRPTGTSELYTGYEYG